MQSFALKTIGTYVNVEYHTLTCKCGTFGLLSFPFSALFGGTFVLYIYSAVFKFIYNVFEVL